jgi:diguanylate cyclase (GGDEF)-like protein
VIDREPRAFSEHELVILRNFANLVVGELELRTIAFTDGLTKLLSRKAWRDRVETEIDRAMRQPSALSVLLLDLDHFKRINDTFGHDVGDLVLKRTSEIFNSVLRKHDLVGRLGGEEFAVCLINAPAHVGRAVAERIRARIAALDFPEHPHLSCSASIGVAVFEPGADVDDLLKRADLALYEAKRGGRDQVRMSDPVLVVN